MNNTYEMRDAYDISQHPLTRALIEGKRVVFKKDNNYYIGIPIASTWELLFDEYIVVFASMPYATYNFAKIQLIPNENDDD